VTHLNLVAVTKDVWKGKGGQWIADPRIGVQSRRSEQERRIDASDTDQDNRRTLGERRETQRGKDWEDAVPVLDWSPPEEEAEENPGRHNFILMVGIVAAVALVPAIFVSIYVSRL